MDWILLCTAFLSFGILDNSFFDSILPWPLDTLSCLADHWLRWLYRLCFSGHPTRRISNGYYLELHPCAWHKSLEGPWLLQLRFQSRTILLTWQYVGRNNSILKCHVPSVRRSNDWLLLLGWCKIPWHRPCCNCYNISPTKYSGHTNDRKDYACGSSSPLQWFWHIADNLFH